MENSLETTKGAGSSIETITKPIGDFMEKGQNNKEGLIGMIALAVLAVAGFAIKVIAGGK